MSDFPWEDPRTVLKRHGFAPSRRFSQNFLVSQGAVETIADAAVRGAGSKVLELGPGAGTLTAALLRREVSVVAVEQDPRMISLLGEEFAGAPLDVVAGDAAALHLDALPLEGEVHLCGNLPYAITGAIFRRLVDQADRVAQAVVMIQREVRDRLVASEGSKTYGALSVFVQAAFEVDTVLEVRPGSFFPPPKVSSSVVRLRRRSTPLAVVDEAFAKVVRGAFQQRRKTLNNALKSLGPAAKEAMAELGIDPKRRGETLSIEEFGALAAAYRAKSAD